VYHFVVRRIVRSVFEHLGEGDFEYALAMASGEIEHTFAGDHCLGGTRTSPSAMRAWFGRLFRLFPSIRFELHQVHATGWPWDTVCVVQWSDRGVAADGEEYVNHGVHVVRVRWGRLTALHAYLDTRRLVEALDRLGRAGYAESQAAPIVG